MVNRSLNTSVNNRSYAVVLKTSFKTEPATGPQKYDSRIPNRVDSHTSLHTAHSKVHCVPAKCTPQRNHHKPLINCKFLPHKHNFVTKGEPYMQEFSAIAE